MPHQPELLVTIAVGLGLAFALGLLAVRLRLPPIVGYMLASIVVGRIRPASSPTSSSPGSWPRSA